jgi:2-hydroxy-3-keto-5-methylthiopentenyl-1-phosphate phosphatase
LGVKNLKKAFVVDFDGTITVKDVGFSIIQKFAGDGWKEIGDRWIKKEIGTSECGQKQWNLINYNDEEIRSFASKFKINPGFKEFIDITKKNSYKVVITSDGYDIYIKEILKRNGLEDLELSCNSAVYDKGWRLSFLNADKECDLCGNCKKKVVEKLKDEGYEVYYVGDGHSDRCACVYADKIFAKSFLKQHCEEQNIPYYDFNTFYDVIKHI